jgi:hypothetical protein
MGGIYFLLPCPLLPAGPVPLPRDAAVIKQKRKRKEKYKIQNTK